LDDVLNTDIVSESGTADLNSDNLNSVTPQTSSSIDESVFLDS
jgi:hypothetical protein